MARKSFSVHQANQLVARLQAAAEFDQQITLSSDEVELLLWSMRRLVYNARRR